MSLPRDVLPTSMKTTPDPIPRFGAVWSFVTARLRQSPQLGIAWLTLLLVVILIFPLFLCMPICCDSIFFDLGARNLLQKGRFYQDLFMHSPPGMVWFQAGIRAVVGWRTEALRAADLVIFLLCIWLLLGKLSPPTLSAPAAVWVAAALLLYYSGMSEWSHCQRDPWMLLPALGALCLRQRQITRLQQFDPSARPLFGFAVLEGICWGAAFLMKPFIVFSALPCFLLSLILIRSTKGSVGRLWLIDILGVLVGGLLVGLLSITVLYLSGDWPFFLENNFGPWYAEYFQKSPSLSKRFQQSIFRIWPLGLVHVITVPASLICVGWVVAARGSTSQKAQLVRVPLALLAVFYLGWFFQANYLQHQYDYHVLPCLLLALVLLLGMGSVFLPTLTVKLLLPMLVVCSVWNHSLLRPQRLALWGRCCVEGSTPQIKDKLASLQIRDTMDTPSDLANPTTSWEDLEKVKGFLRTQNVRDREVTCYSIWTMSLYMELGISPSSRFVSLSSYLYFFSKQSESILREVRAGPQRFVVTDLADYGLRPEKYHSPIRLHKSPIFPFNHPVVFRTGRYLVHLVTPTPDNARGNNSQKERGAARHRGGDHGP